MPLRRLGAARSSRQAPSCLAARQRERVPRQSDSSRRAELALTPSLPPFSALLPPSCPPCPQIVSGSRDKSIKLWNTLGECKYTIAEPDGHTEWVSCVRFSPVTANPIIVSAGWDKLVKVWSLTNCKLRNNLAGHQGYVNTVTVSPDGSLCASGGKDGVAMLWDLAEGKRLYSLDAGDIIHSLCFSPNRYWLCAATQSGIKIWDLESKSVVDELRPDLPERSKKAQVPYPVCLAWSADGSTLYSGYTDGVVRVWQVRRRPGQGGAEGAAGGWGCGCGGCGGCAAGEREWCVPDVCPLPASPSRTCRWDASPRRREPPRPRRGRRQDLRLGAAPSNTPTAWKEQKNPWGSDPAALIPLRCLPAARRRYRGLPLSRVVRCSELRAHEE